MIDNQQAKLKKNEKIIRDYENDIRKLNDQIGNLQSQLSQTPTTPSSISSIPMVTPYRPSLTPASSSSTSTAPKLSIVQAAQQTNPMGKSMISSQLLKLKQKVQQQKKSIPADRPGVSSPPIKNPGRIRRARINVQWIDRDRLQLKIQKP